MPNPMSLNAVAASVPAYQRMRRGRPRSFSRSRVVRGIGIVMTMGVLGGSTVGGVLAANPYEATYVDEAGVWRSNCVWWAWQRWSEVHGEELPQWGNAGQWTAGAIAAGYTVDGIPAAGSIVATWESPLGHVAFVEQVDPADPSTFLVSEYGFATGTMEHQRWMTTDGSLLFIHPMISTPPVATTVSRELPEQEGQVAGRDRSERSRVVQAPIHYAGQQGAWTPQRGTSVAP